MKAKVVKTGEIVDVVPVYDCWQHIEGFKETKSDNARYFDTSEINILCTSKKIDWKQYRVELAKAAMQGILSNEFLLKRLEQTVPEIADKGNKDVIASLSVEYADAVITKLKE